ncbi:hypothetical protein, partial [Reichenbachiella sp.]
GTSVAGFGNEGYLNVIKSPWDEYFPTPRDLQALTDKIEKLYLNEDIRKEMSEWGIAEAKTYEWEHITNQVFEVYDEVMAR